MANLASFEVLINFRVDELVLCIIKSLDLLSLCSLGRVIAKAFSHNCALCFALYLFREHEKQKQGLTVDLVGGIHTQKPTGAYSQIVFH